MPPTNLAKQLAKMERWMSDDMRLLKDGVTDATGEVHRPNASALLTICCYIDSLGGSLAGRDKESFHYKGHALRAEFVAFIDRYMQAFMRASKNARGRPIKRSVRKHRCAPGCGTPKKDARERLTYPEILYAQFRNGLVHEFLPRGRSGFVRGDEAYLRWDTMNRRLVVNIDRLADDFCHGLCLYCADVRGDSKVRANYRKRLRFVLRH